jgi:hypothetical protein
VARKSKIRKNRREVLYKCDAEEKRGRSPCHGQKPAGKVKGINCPDRDSTWTKSLGHTIERYV